MRTCGYGLCRLLILALATQSSAVLAQEDKNRDDGQTASGSGVAEERKPTPRRAANGNGHGYGYAAKEKKPPAKRAEPKAVEDAIRYQVAIPGAEGPRDELRHPARVASSDSRRQRERLFLGLAMPTGSAHEVGKFLVTPTIMTTGRYTDNVFLESSGGKSDWQTRIVPRVDLAYPAGKHTIRLGAYGEILRSLESPSEWNDEHYGAQAQFILDLLDAWTLELSDAYDRLSVDPGASDDVRRHYYSNTASAVLGYSFGDKWSAEAGYSHLIKRYRHRDERTDDVTEQAGNARLYYEVLPRISAFGDYGYSHSTRKTDSARDSDNYTYSVGLRWDATAKLDGTISLGYSEKDFRRGKGERGIYYTASLDYAATDRLRLTLTGTRRPEETSAADRDLANGPSYMSSSLGLNASYLLMENWFLTAALRLSKSEYTRSNPEGGTRDDENRAAAIGVRYQALDWLNMTLEASRIENSSNVSTQGYTEHSVSLTLNLTL